MSRCGQCNNKPRLIGVLCGACADKLKHESNLTPEQFESQPIESPSFFLVDVHGRAHAGIGGFTLGRMQAPKALAILSASVSRLHARIESDVDGFSIRDMGSTNGTFVDGQVATRGKLAFNQVVSTGDASFYFLPPNLDLSRVAPPLTTSATAVREPFSSRADTVDGLASLAPQIKLTEASGGGGGLLSFGGNSLRLTLAQFELLQILASRASSDRGLAPEIRGFVSTGELIAEISWETASPDDNNVKQLVRRIRSALKASEMPPLIDSSAGFGYRIAAGFKLH